MVKQALNTSSATLLVCHGSRDSRSQIAAERLLYLVKEHYKVENPTTTSNRSHRTALLTKSSPSVVDLGFLECTDVPLHQQIITVAEQAFCNNELLLQVFPLFLSAGVHVKEDIPQEITIAQQNLQSRIKLNILPYLGSSTSIFPLLAQRFQTLPSQGRILLAHGSRRLGGNQRIEQMAAQLGAIPAYWSVQPDLRQQIKVLAQQGISNIAIMPYFLFSGGILHSLQQQIYELTSDYPNLSLSLGHPLGATPELAQLIVKEIENA
ncbi:MAG: sirohydrochlorin chelatase [Microcystaceae cyanobacterium]